MIVMADSASLEIQDDLPLWCVLAEHGILAPGDEGIPIGQSLHSSS